MNAAIPVSNVVLDFDSFCHTLADSQRIWERRKSELLQLIEAKPLLLFGFGGKGAMLAHQIRQSGSRELAVFDSSATRRVAAARQGFRVMDRLDAALDAGWAPILGACQAQIEQREAVGPDFLYYQEAANLLGAPHLAHLARDFETYTATNQQDLYRVYRALHPMSRQRFLQVLCFRISSDPGCLQGVRQANAEMWLDLPALYKRRAYRTFLDVGAFDGDTLRAFHERFDCERGIAVEANPDLFEAIRQVGTLYSRGIDIMPVAAWSSATRLRFDEVRFGMIQVSESQDGPLQAAPMDAHVQEPVDCLKMDIEGAESEALEGSRRLLQQFQPDLGVAAYHRPQDLVALFDQISRLGYDGEGFEWHFGHYSDCLDDSIFYVLRGH